MSAFTDLLQFATELTPVQSKRFLDLLSAHITEEQRQVNLLLAYTSADSKPLEVVAIAGTAETLLNEINVGDTVELNPNVEADLTERNRLKVDKITESKMFVVMQKHTFDTGACIGFAGTYWHNARLFRKVATPLSNPHQTVSGC